MKILNLAPVTLVAFTAVFGWAETPVEYSSEARFQLDLHVPDEALRTYFPSGFMPNIATQGAAKEMHIK